MNLHSGCRALPPVRPLLIELLLIANEYHNRTELWTNMLFDIYTLCRFCPHSQPIKGGLHGYTLTCNSQQLPTITLSINYHKKLLVAGVLTFTLRLCDSICFPSLVAETCCDWTRLIVQPDVDQSNLDCNWRLFLQLNEAPRSYNEVFSF